MKYRNYYLKRLHLFIIEELDLTLISTKRYPLLFGLILTAQKPSLTLIMLIGSFILLIIPLDSTITITSNKLPRRNRFPLEPSARIPTHPTRISNIKYLALINIINPNLTIRTGSPNKLIIWTDFQREYLCMHITEEVDHTRMALGKVGEF